MDGAAANDENERFQSYLSWASELNRSELDNEEEFEKEYGPKLEDDSDERSGSVEDSDDIFEVNYKTAVPL